MNCREARDLLPAAALGELDREVQTALAAHVSACGPCRAAEAELRRTVGALAGAAPVPASQERRARAVEAMNAAYERHVLSRVRRLGPAWRLPVAFAAAALVAFSGGVVVAPRGVPRVPMARVTEVVRRAFVQVPGEGSWRALARGDALYVGDRVSGELEARIGARASFATIGAESRVVLLAADPPALALDDGRVLCNAATPLTVVGPAGERIACERPGTFEASLEPVADARPGGWRLKEAAAAIEKKTNKKIAIHPKLEEEGLRVEFDPEGDALIERLEQALGPDLAILPTQDGYFIGPVAAARGPADKRLRVQFADGEGTLSGARGQVTVSSGEFCRINGRGEPLEPRRASAAIGRRDARTHSLELTMTPDENLVRINGADGVLRHQNRKIWIRVADATARLDLSSPRAGSEVPVKIEYGVFPLGKP
jgi:hypothetical protein